MAGVAAGVVNAGLGGYARNGYATVCVNRDEGGRESMMSGSASSQVAYRIVAGRVADRARLQQALGLAAGPRVVVLSHVALADLLRVPAHTPGAIRHRQQLSGKRVDAVLLDRDTFRVHLAVVLAPSPAERGAFVVASLRAAGVPVILVCNAELDMPERLAARVTPLLPASADQSIEVPVVPPTIDTPACPTCGAPMVLRRKLHGADHGRRFWGCSTYAQTGCRGLRPAWVAL